MSLAQIQFSTPFGPMFAVASENGLRSLYSFEKEIPAPNAGSAQAKILSQLVDQMEQYFSGNLTQFEVPLDPVGTEFQKKVWRQLSLIPYGQTISYLQLAKNIGNLKASRAVGSANGKNPLWVVVPCHRVITSSGALGGYAGGLHMKSFLLDLENASLSKNAKF
ncbi:hypothetical protein AZI86_01365 [Bdellovibrio bacteriovorus]|uniref:Methylated-DNA--protein-cysteine methyltransferase n=1 Tax=Bdellovibrio bacteriovorus TaxID=959 RepID=A0A150WMM6_BDEBC|nr:methylated-DNA--[protein]-cysteine S-methyltransferase [Bdellovibrio bacteriovorus]KYG65753.1 hypothetical protein AZI86_01365 [Bdellovibrio bacteriovorus]